MTIRNIDSTLSLAIMGLISYQSMSGYDLRKVFISTAMRQFSASPGAIYPALRRLEEAGLIKGEIEKKNTLRPRKVYTLTSSGLDALKENLSQPVSQDDVIWRTDALMLRFTFICELLGKEKMLKFLEEFLGETEAYIKVLEKEHEALRKVMSFCSRSSFEHGIAVYRSNARWAKRIIEEIQKQGEIK